MPRLWLPDSNIQVIGEEAQGKGIMCKMDVKMWEKSNKFCILNSQAMRKWVEEYEEAEQERIRERANFRRNCNTINQPYPNELQVLPKFPKTKWLGATILKAKCDGIMVAEEEEELALGCDWHVSKFTPFFLLMFPSKFFA